MSDYELSWITDDLAVGYAPMSYADLKAISAQGINAIVNLCGEFCDLHEIEEKSGFEVFYLPIPDECAPNMEEMEKGLAWLDEAIYLGKKVLVHCRFGIGRTGTFVTSYLIRRGLGLKVATKKLKDTRAQPATYRQWKLLKKYGKECGGILTIREPTLESKNVVDLGVYFNEYEALMEKVDADIKCEEKTEDSGPVCGQETDTCCYGYFELSLIEVIYLFNMMNRTLKSQTREAVIHEACKVRKKIRGLINQINHKMVPAGDSLTALKKAFIKEKNLCPLNMESKCLLFEYRPIRCRCDGIGNDAIDIKLIEDTLNTLSRNVFFAFSGHFLEDDGLSFSLADTVSGRFVQEYFYYLASM